MKKQKLFLAILMILCFCCGEAYANLEKIMDKSRQSSTDLKPFPKWTRVLNQHPKDKKLINEACKDRSSPCFMKEWISFLNSIRGKSRSEQISAVNSYMNKWEYVTDLVNWGIDDYWETPLEFFRKSGDCEDYAIAKFFSLRELGFRNEDMKIVVLMDKNLNILHSVLSLNHSGSNLILDNQVKEVVQASRIYHYDPIYSINETTWWRYH